MINRPIMNADDYLVDDEPEAAPKHGTTSQAGWAAASAFLNKKKSANSESKYANFVKFSEQGVLVRFLDDEPFKVYEEHWVDNGTVRRSFICLGDDCPLCTIAGDHPRPKFAFNVVVLSDENPSTQILVAVPTLAKLLQAAHEDAKKGPLSRYYWEIKRLGMGRDTQYTLDRVRSTDLAEEFELDPDDVADIVSQAVRYDDSAIIASPRDEMLTIARSLVA